MKLANEAELTAGKNLAWNSLLNLGTGIFIVGLNIVFVPLMLHAFGIELYGVLAITWIVLANFSWLDFGFSRASAKYVAMELALGRQDQAVIWTWTAVVSQAFLGLLGALVLWFLAPLIVDHIHVQQQNRDLVILTLKLFAFSIPIDFANRSISGVLQAGQRFDWSNGLGLLNTLSTFAVYGFGILRGSDFRTVIYGLFILRVVNLLASYWGATHVLPSLKSLSWLGGFTAGYPSRAIVLVRYPVASGRVNALVVDPRDPQVVYLGAAEGGVWKTTDGGTNWFPKTDAQASLAIGSIALDPSNPDIVYVGTGEENFNGDSYYGEGILKSIDAGATWTHIPGPFAGPSFNSPTRPDSYYGGGARIGSIAVHPSNGQIVLVTAFGGQHDGVWRSTDGGTNWTNVISFGIGTSVVFNPRDGSIAYAGVRDRGVYVSSDAGATWTPDNGAGANSLPTSSILGVQLAIDALAPATLYASLVDISGKTLNGLFKTIDGGANWTKLPLTGIPNADFCRQQCYYDNVVRVDPANSSIVFVGGSAGSGNLNTLFRSTDGGNNWTNVSRDAIGDGPHVDQHAMAFSSDGLRLYVGNDGGVWSASPEAAPISWTNLNLSLAITQFYPGMVIDPTSATRTFAGTQDNGTLEYYGPGWRALDGCGDGGWMAMDPTNLNTLYNACTKTQGVLRSTSGGSLGSWTHIESGLDASERSSTFPPLVLDPSSPQTLYFGTFRVYQTTNGGGGWTPISPELTSPGRGHLTTLAVAPSDLNIVYAGTSDSHVQVTTNAKAGAGAVWRDASLGLPPRFVTQIAVDQALSTTAYVTFSGFSGFGGDHQGHVFKTTTGGASWTDVSGAPGGSLPNIPINDIVVDPSLPNTLYVASDIGVFSTSNGGLTWSTLMTGLPNVAILSLKLHAGSRTLRAASHGRSAWDLNVPLAGTVAPSTATAMPASLSFADRAPGTTSAPQAVTFTNTGTTPVTITGVVITGPNGADFAQAIAGNPCAAGISVAANGVCTVNITFTPTTPGGRSGVLNIISNAQGSPQTVALGGSGADFLISLAPASLPSATLPAGQTANYSVAISGTPGFSRSVALACTGAPALAHCTIAPNPVSLTLSSIPLAAIVTVTITARSVAVPRSTLRPPPAGVTVREWARILLPTSLLSLPLGIALALAAWGLAHTRRTPRYGTSLLSEKRIRLGFASTVLLAVLLGTVSTLSCGGGGAAPSFTAPPAANPGTPAGTYTLTLTGTSTSGTVTTSRSLPLTLTVQ